MIWRISEPSRSKASNPAVPVFREIARVLRPGGRIGISDIVADNALSAADRAERGSYVGCIAGALSIGEFEAGLHAVGLADVSVTPTHAVAEGMHSAIIRATKPKGGVWSVGSSPSVGVGLPVLVAREADSRPASTGCCGGSGCC